MGSKSYSDTDIKDDRDVLTGPTELGVIAGGSVNITRSDADVAKAAIAAATSSADQATKALAAAFGTARSTDQALLDSVLAATAAEREADAKLLEQALTPELRSAGDVLKTLQIVVALAAGAWVLSRWSG
jgi:hypothetical protein